MGPREAATARVYWAMTVGMTAALAWFVLAAEVRQPGAKVQCAAPGWPWPFEWWWGAVAVGVGFMFAALEAQRLCPDDAAPSSGRGVLLASAAASTIMMLVAVRAVGRAYRALYGVPLEGGPSSGAGLLWLSLPLVATVLLHEACHLAVFRLFGTPTRLRVVFWPRLVVATEFDQRETPVGVLALSLVAPVVLLTALGFVLMAEPLLAPWTAWAVAANWAGSVPDLGRLAMLAADLPLCKGVGRGGEAATLW